MKYEILSIVRLENHYRVSIHYIPNFIERVFLNKVPERIEVFGKGECWYKVSDYKVVLPRAYSQRSFWQVGPCASNCFQVILLSVHSKSTLILIWS